MNLENFKKQWINFASRMNKYGVPIPLVRDPKTGVGSVSLTLVFISFNAVLIGLVGKWAGALGGIDINQALNLFYACAALYWGRKFQNKDLSIQEEIIYEPLQKRAQEIDRDQKVDQPD